MRVRYRDKSMRKDDVQRVIRLNEQYEIDFEVMMLWTLHRYCGFGKKRLLRFREQYIKEVRRLREYYAMEDATFPARIKLRELGVDVEALTKEEQKHAE